MAAPKVRRWDDTSAPVLTGEEGVLITLLDAVLVNGYGSQSALGWTKEYSGTNKAAYRNNTGGTGFYFRVDDGLGVTNAESAHLRGYESMTDVDSGSGTFPTVDDVYLLKSSSADTTVRPWVIYGDEFGFWYMSYAYDTTTGLTTTEAVLHWVGDFITLVSGDSYASGIGGQPAIDNDDGAMGYTKVFDGAPSSTGSGLFYCARRADGTGANGDNLFAIIEGTQCGTTRMGADGVQAATWNGQVLYAKLGGVCDGLARTYRGRMPCIYECLHDFAFMTDDVLHGNMHYHMLRSNRAYGGFMMDTTGDFR